MGTRKTVARVVAVAVAALLAAAVSMQPSQASDSGDGYYQPPTPYQDSGRYDPGCGDTGIKARFWVHGVDSLKSVKGSHGQAFLLDDTYRFFEKWRDSDGNTLLTWRGRFHFKEFFARRVAKSQVPDDVIPPEGLVGPIYLFKSRLTGREVVHDDDGDVLARTRGLQAFANLFDTLGDGVPGGTALQFDVTKTEGSFPPLFVEDVCALAEEELSH
jgi:hypothetical protein